MCTSFEQPTVMWQVQTQFNALKRHPPILRRYDDMIILCVHCLSQKGIFLTGLCTASVLQLHTLFLRVGFQLRGCTVPLCVESQRGWQERGRKLVLLRKLSMVDGNIKISSLLAMNIVRSDHSLLQAICSRLYLQSIPPRSLKGAFYLT